MDFLESPSQVSSTLLQFLRPLARMSLLSTSWATMIYVVTQLEETGSRPVWSVEIASEMSMA